MAETLLGTGIWNKNDMCGCLNFLDNGVRNLRICFLLEELGSYTNLRQSLCRACGIGFPGISIITRRLSLYNFDLSFELEF